MHLEFSRDEWAEVFVLRCVVVDYSCVLGLEISLLLSRVIF